MAGSDGRFTVLFVCTGNICRSPQAERLFASELARHGLGGLVKVSSAGTAALEGRPIEPQAAELTESYGGDPSAHTARRLVESYIDEADLVLTMERSHRADVVRMLPRANRYAFTLREFDRLVLDLAESGEVDRPDLATGPADRLRELVPQVAARRGMSGPSTVAEDEVEDPYRRSSDAYARSARQVATSVSAVASRLVELAELIAT